MSSYCIYLRKSRADMEAEAHGEGETLTRHLELLLSHARRSKLPITEIYKEVASGDSIAARPEMQKLLAAVDANVWTGVLVVDIDRLARGDTIDQGIVAQAFKYSGTKIITPAKTYDPADEFDEEYFEFGLFMSRREYKTINRRLQRGRLASVKEGKYVANRPPYGYEREKLDREKGYTLKPHPEQAPVVKMVFDWYTRGIAQPDGSLQRIGVSLIARRLNELGIPPQRGKVWNPASLRDMLQNPTYAGKLRWNWRPAVKRVSAGQIEISRPRSDETMTITDGRHEAIIDPETFDQAQQIMSENPPNPVAAQRKTMNPLAGLVRCGVCGRSMVRRPYTNGQQETLLCYMTSCNNVSAPLHLVEGRVLQALADWLTSYKVEWAELGRSTPVQRGLDIKRQALRKSEQELNALRQQQDSLHELLERRIYDADTYLSRSRLLSERVEQIQQAISIMADELATEEQQEATRSMIIPQVEQILDIYRQLDSPAEKNHVLKQVLEKVVYMKSVNGRWHNSPEDFELIIYPRLPKQG